MADMGDKLSTQNSDRADKLDTENAATGGENDIVKGVDNIAISNHHPDGDGAGNKKSNSDVSSADFKTVREESASSLEGASNLSNAIGEREGNDTRFDVKFLLESFQRCQSNNLLDLAAYIQAYEEIVKFFDLLGNIFSFVNSDVVEKATILKEYNTGDIPAYKTIHGMLAYEVENSLTNAKLKAGKLPSAARTLLRLHRALLFTVQFMRGMIEQEMTENLRKQAHAAYGKTLAMHHTWVVRKAVNIALYLVPTKRALLDKLDKYDDAVTQETLTKVCDVAQKVYDMTEAWYTEFKLHDLP